MSVVISYIRADEPVVSRLAADLASLDADVWLDQSLVGGDDWWTAVVRKIEGARLLVFALSERSWGSTPCRAELDYAQRLGIPVLFVRVGPGGDGTPGAVDYVGGRGDVRARLALELARLTARPVMLAETVPEPPPLPFGYLRRIADALGPHAIQPDEQAALVGLFRDKLAVERDEVARADLRALLDEFRKRPELPIPIAAELDGLWHRPPGPAAPARTGGVFVSYRREGTAHIAGRLADRLTDRFGEDQVFMDVESIEPGLDFRDVITDAIDRCDILLVIIGPGWATARLAEPDDLVRIEIEAALRRGIRVIPVFVDDAEMPRAADLPQSLAALARRHGTTVRHASFRQDVARLLDVLDRARGLRQSGG